MNTLSVVLATRNEETNIERCLRSVAAIADEVIVVDENSTDGTREIAREMGAKVYIEPHHDNFHITKQKALSKATKDWILQLDADEVVTTELAEQIKDTINGNPPVVENPLFKIHQELIEKRDGKIGKDDGEVAGYFIPRKNIFLGKPLIHGGVYPDGVIRLVKNGKAFLPAKSVHEQIEIDGKTGWLSGDLLHYDSPTLKRYLWRLNRYTDLQAKQLKDNKVDKGLMGFLFYCFWKPIATFLNIYFKHMGLKDGASGFLWAFFSASHFPIAYFKYATKKD